MDAGTETNANLYHEVYYHFLGTDQSDDVLCWRDQDHPKYLFSASVTDDGKVIVPCFMVWSFVMIYDCFLISCDYVGNIMVLELL